MSDVPGAYPTVSNQGSLALCTRHALAKSVVDGFMRKRFLPGVQVDFNQREVISVLNNEHKVRGEIITFFIDKVLCKLQLQLDYDGLVICYKPTPTGYNCF